MSKGKFSFGLIEGLIKQWIIKTSRLNNKINCAGNDKTIVRMVKKKLYNGRLIQW